MKYKLSYCTCQIESNDRYNFTTPYIKKNSFMLLLNDPRVVPIIQSMISQSLE